MAIWPWMIAGHISMGTVCMGGGLVSECLNALDKKTYYFSLSGALHVVPSLESLRYHVGSHCTQTNLLHLSIHLFVLKNSQNGNMSSNVYLKYLAWLKTSYSRQGNEEHCPGFSCAADCNSK